MKKTGKNRRLFYVILVFVFVLVVVILVFNRHGFIALAKLRNDIENTSLSIDSLQQQMDMMNSEIEQLLSDSAYMEKMVREILGWGREGEHIVRFIRPDSSGVIF